MSPKKNRRWAALLGLAVAVVLTPTAAATTIDASAPLAAVQQALLQLEERTAKIVRADKEVDDARQRVADLERRILAAKNPLLAPPTADDPTTGAPGVDWHGLDNAERVIRIEEMLAEAREDLHRAERQRARLQRAPTTCPCQEHDPDLIDRDRRVPVRISTEQEPRKR